jgi:hypothetical protein
MTAALLGVVGSAANLESNPRATEGEYDEVLCGMAVHLNRTQKKGNTMRSAPLALAALVSFCAHAEQGVDFLTSFHALSSAVQMGDTTVTARGGAGTMTIINSTGDMFKVGQSAIVHFVGLSKKTPTGFELEADGVADFENDPIQIVAIRRTGNIGAGTSGEGRAHMKSNRFEADCSYSVVGLPDNWGVTIYKCRW